MTTKQGFFSRFKSFFSSFLNSEKENAKKYIEERKEEIANYAKNKKEDLLMKLEEKKNTILHLKETANKYNELLGEVKTKIKGKTRHETAIMLIRKAQGD
jgi:DNA-binding transcriptional regulator GbsR (MarR family)